MPSPEPTPAFSALYEEHVSFVWAVLRRLGVRDADLEDVAQDVFVVVHRRLDSYEARSAVRTWLYGITVRVYWNYARRHRNRPAPAETSSSHLAAPTGAGDPEGFAVRKQASGVLRELLSKLDPAKRTVFVLSELEGLTAPEIARVTGANTRTVYSRLRAARTRFEAGLARVRAQEQGVVSARELAAHAAQDDRPPPAAVQRTWAALLVRVQEPAAAAVATTGFGALKIGAASAAVTAGVVALAAAIVGIGPGELGPPQASARSPAAASAVQPEPAEPRPAEPMPEASPAAVETEPPAVLVDEELAAAPAAPRRVAPGKRSAARRRGQPADSQRSGAAPTPPSRSQPAEDPVLAELKLMHRARGALKAGKGREGLRLLAEHERRYPKGQLAPERRRSKITALCAVGERARAQALAKKLGLPASECP